MRLSELELREAFPPADLKAWRALVETDLGGAPFDKKLVSHTYEGIRVQPLYTAADWDGSGDPSGFSGAMPMTRGARVLGQRALGWDLCQERAEPDLAMANRAILEDLEGGVNTVLLRLDACARHGLDPDDPRAGTLAGSDGVMAYSLEDLRTALSGVHLRMIGVWLEAGAAFVPAAGMLASLWEGDGVGPREAHGAFNADPLAVLARDGHLPYSLEEGLGRLAGLAEWTAGRYPHVTSVRVGTAAYHHAGATATQDVAIALATGLEYLRAMTGAGMSVDQAARQIRFSMAVGCGFFLAIAKLRAARRGWARVVEACGGSIEARRMSVHVRPSKRVLSTRDPWVNILRNTACVFAAGVGGADAVGSTPFDATLGLPSALGRRLARNTHHLLMEECHLHRVNDPAGGSWYLEKLTDEVAERAWVILQAIESRGGMARALSSGWVSGQIDSAFAPRARNLATRRDPVVGVSEFASVRESRPETPTVDAEALRSAARRRASAQRAAAAGAVDAAGRGSDAARAHAMAGRGATIGQIEARLARAGDRPATLAAPLAVHPFAEPFERLREASDRLAEQCGARPRVFLASVGRPSQHLARTTFARNLFEAGGFEVVGGTDFADAPAAAAGLAGSGASVAVICGSDEQYPALVPQLAAALHGAGARRVVLAGNPGDREAADRAAGVDRFVFVRCDVVGVLRELLIEEGAVL